MKKIILTICVLCLFVSALGIAVLPTPVVTAQQSSEVAGLGWPPPPPPLLPIEDSFMPSVAWNS